MKQPPLPLVRTVEFLRGALAALHRRLVPGHIALMEMFTAGWLAQAVAAAAELGIADALARGPRTLAELAVAVDADEDALRRLLCLLTSHGVFAEDARGRYRSTPAARALRTDSEVSLRDVILFFGTDFHRGRWTRLVDAVRTGAPIGGASAFFDLVAEDRALGASFDRAMTSIGGLSTEALLDAYDFARYDTIVDIGGGEGRFIAEILRRAPRSRGILFDMPEVVAGAPERLAELGVADRCSIESGSFFDAVPTGGDLYVLKHIVHDWDSERIATILRVLRTAMPPTARLLLVELVLPHHNRPHPGKYIDLEMLINTGGRERDATEYRDLLARSGFTLLRHIATVAPDQLLEAAPN
ncbi:methyltransferase [Nocardia bovistercoris]|uniref:Hydroxyneurosporene methyltransferase n=1 Tax=Nocardia bovistercoris TaxID=2785916 RepID=A0A931I9F5_9NOCA|nr:methyltransferase [Nocardia bovistercoris]MBH0777159.1 hydroxyneurosporene methyltransferase [Nocardia bovistercoris]